eukprot:2693025-Lingulodinium_polyedra.AAC.1
MGWVPEDVELHDGGGFKPCPRSQRAKVGGPRKARKEVEQQPGLGWAPRPLGEKRRAALGGRG